MTLFGDDEVSEANERAVRYPVTLDISQCTVCCDADMNKLTDSTGCFTGSNKQVAILKRVKTVGVGDIIV